MSGCRFLFLVVLLGCLANSISCYTLVLGTTAEEARNQAAEQPARGFSLLSLLFPPKDDDELPPEELQVLEESEPPKPPKVVYFPVPQNGPINPFQFPYPFPSPNTPPNTTLSTISVDGTNVTTFGPTTFPFQLPITVNSTNAQAFLSTASPYPYTNSIPYPYPSPFTPPNPYPSPFTPPNPYPNPNPFPFPSANPYPYPNTYPRPYMNPYPPTYPYPYRPPYPYRRPYGYPNPGYPPSIIINSSNTQPAAPVIQQPVAGPSIQVSPVIQGPQNPQYIPYQNGPDVQTITQTSPVVGNQNRDRLYPIRTSGTERFFTDSRESGLPVIVIEKGYLVLLGKINRSSEKN